MSRKGSIGTRFVDIFEEDDQQAVTDALARAADGSTEEVGGARPCIFLRTQPERLSTASGVQLDNWTLLQHNDGFLATVAPAAGTTGPSSSETEELKDFFNKAPIALHWLSSNGKVLWANDP